MNRKLNKNPFATLMLFTTLLIVFSCKVAEDKHPDVPFLNDIISDTEYFKLIDVFNNNELAVLLKNNHFYVHNYNDVTTKIINLQGEIVYKNEAKTFPNYFDSNGNYYANSRKYFVSNYKNSKPITVVDIRDSINDFREKVTNNGEINDSITLKRIEDYDWSMHSKYDLILEREGIIRSAIDTVKVKRDTLIYFSNKQQNHYVKKALKFDKFDKSIIINKHSTGGPFGGICIDYMNYLVIGKKKLKVKAKDHDKIWKLYTINDNLYLFDEHNLYEVLN